jgi:quercetin dioxygenase-like cupin family protein
MSARLESKYVPKPWGSETWIVNNDLYCGKVLTVSQGAACSLHYHPVKHETFLVRYGQLMLELGDERYLLEPGDIIQVLPGTPHRFTAILSSQLYEFSTYHSDDDVVRLEPSSGI